MKNENKKLDNKAIIDIYNDFVVGQKKINPSSVYFCIEYDTVKKFTPEHKHEFEKFKKEVAHLIPRQMWEKILSQDKKYKPTQKDFEIKKIKRDIDFELKTFEQRIRPPFTTKLYDSGDIISMYKSSGLLVLPYHFDWYEKNDILTPILKIKNKRYYSVYQIYTLDYLEMKKEETLRYPNPTYHPSMGWIRTSTPTWKEHLLLNKKYILENEVGWNNVAKILLDIKDLFDSFDNKSYKDFKKIIGHRKESAYKDIFNNLIITIGDFYALKIKKRHPNISEGTIRYWVNVCISRMVKLNPFFEKVSELNPLSKIIAESNNLTLISSANDIRNQIKLANFYHKTADFLIFYLECLNSKKEKTVEEIIRTSSRLTKPSDNHSKICVICSIPFLPPPTKTGGRNQITCGSENCRKDWAKKHQCELRKRRKSSKNIS